MKISTTVETDAEGHYWPLLQFGPVEDEAEAQMMLEVMREFFTQRFGSPVTPEAA